MTDGRGPAGRAALARLIDDRLTTDEWFRERIARDDEGTFSMIIATWDDTMADVFDHYEDFGVPATILLPVGELENLDFLTFTLRHKPSEDAGAGEGHAYLYDPTEPFRNFVMEVLEHKSVYLKMEEAPRLARILPFPKRAGDATDAQQLLLEYAA